MFSDKEKKILKDLAQRSVQYAVEKGEVFPIDLSEFPDYLQKKRASFVTLYKSGELRGCIGRLESRLPFVEDIAENSYSVCYRDDRFPPVKSNELPFLDIHISVLTDPQKLEVDSEEDLLKKIRPGVDGLIISEGYRSATFLPSVWEQVPDPSEFLRHLKNKAGFSKDYWSEKMEVFIYQAYEI